MSGHAVLADLAATPPLPPLERAVLIDDRGYALLPHPFDKGAGMRLPVGDGLTIDWTPIDRSRILVALWAGWPDRPTDESIATSMTRADLQQLILGLISIDQQIGAI